MGLLNRKDSTIYRNYFKECAKLIGIECSYQYVVKQDLTIHSEDNSTLSQPIPLNILFDENPSVDTLNRMGWVIELGTVQPVVATLPYDTPNLTVNARITVMAKDGLARQRVYRITKIASDIEYPSTWSCTLVPIMDQIPQENKYTLINNEKINSEDSKVTKQDSESEYANGTSLEDTTPKDYIETNNNFSFINDNTTYNQ